MSEQNNSQEADASSEKSGHSHNSSGQPVSSESNSAETVTNEPEPSSGDSSGFRESSTDDNGNSVKENQPMGAEEVATGPDVSSEEFAELSAFRRDCLIVISGMDTPKGLEIKDELERYYDESVNHGRLYPNLDTLVEKGMIQKIEIDARSNGYLLSDLGRAHLRQRRQWESDARGLSTTHDSALRDSTHSRNINSVDNTSDSGSYSNEVTSGSSKDNAGESTATQATEGDTQEDESGDVENPGDITQEIMDDLEDEL